MKGVILAAGKGTRMREFTRNRPKPMLKVAKRSILEHIFDALKATGIHELIVVTGRFANIIENHFGDGSRFGFKITYVRQKVIDGTGSATLLTEPFVSDSPFFLTYGDIITWPQNYPKFLEFYRNRPCKAQLAVYEVDDPWRGAAVYVDGDGKVIDIVEKPPKGSSKSKLNNAGLYVFDPIIFKYLKQIGKSPRGEYELTDAIRLMIQDGHDVRAVRLEGYWGDMATPEDVMAMTRYLESKGAA
ncbi:MAG: nucleotidyltransferase family protein [Candidatus Hydrothermota bacterium]|nr:MAG: nucleotidyltransferase family protein [Candidatus Hydrothermae bacterium]